jgi:type IV pilus secretin PilQ/predicted competence protein
MHLHKVNLVKRSKRALHHFVILLKKRGGNGNLHWRAGERGLNVQLSGILHAGGVLSFALVMANVWGCAAPNAAGKKPKPPVALVEQSGRVEKPEVLSSLVRRPDLGFNVKTEDEKGSFIAPGASSSSRDVPESLSKTQGMEASSTEDLVKFPPSAPSRQTPDVQPEPAPNARRYNGKPISLDVMDADLRNVLRLLADVSKTNIVIEPDVSGKVTVKVEQVPWDQMLDMVLAMHDLGKEQIGNVIRIARHEKLTQEWSQQAETIKTRQDLMEAAKDVGEITTVYMTVNYAPPVEIAAKIGENKSEKGKITVDERTSLIIYSDYPARIRSARQLLARLDKATQQVLIEARIVTINSEALRSLGINWNLATEHQTYDPGLTQNFQISVPPPFPSAFAFNIGQLMGETFLRVDAVISALEASRDLKIIAAPRVLTLNHVQAKITQGTQIPFKVQSTTDSEVVSYDFKDATVELRVTPHITPDRKVRLEIFAKQDEPGIEYDGQASIDKREIVTELLVDDGNIVVIGGVIRERSERIKSGTPGFSKVPILGRLFKEESGRREKTELLIFINPRIVEPSRTPGHQRIATEALK